MKMAKWQLRQAKNRLSEVVRKAREEGPQTITLHGNDAGVVLHVQEYYKLSRKPQGRLVEFFRRLPLNGVTLNVSRFRDTGRSVDL